MIPGRRTLFCFPWKALLRIRPGALCSGIGWMAERSKALVSGTSLFGGEGSNPSSVTSFLFFRKTNLTRFRKFGPWSMSRLAQLVERKTLNLVVVGSSPTVGIFAPVAQLAARRSHNPKVASSILAGSKLFFPAESIFFFGKQY